MANRKPYIILTYFIYSIQKLLAYEKISQKFLPQSRFKLERTNARRDKYFTEKGWLPIPALHNGQKNKGAYKNIQQERKEQ